jgi:predicted nucleic acid-binding protein
MEPQQEISVDDALQVLLAQHLDVDVLLAHLAPVRER